MHKIFFTGGYDEDSCIEQETFAFFMGKNYIVLIWPFGFWSLGLCPWRDTPELSIFVRQRADFQNYLISSEN